MVDNTMFATLAALLPKASGYRERLGIVRPPPSPFIAGCMIFRMVDGTERNRELVTHLEGHFDCAKRM